RRAGCHNSWHGLVLYRGLAATRVRPLDRQFDDETRAAIDLALGAHATAVGFRDLPYDVQAEAEPGRGALTRDLVAIEDARQSLGGDPGSVVLDHQRRDVFVRARADRDVTPGRVPEGVGD